MNQAVDCLVALEVNVGHASSRKQEAPLLLPVVFLGPTTTIYSLF